VKRPALVPSLVLALTCAACSGAASDNPEAGVDEAAAPAQQRAGSAPMTHQAQPARTGVAIDPADDTIGWIAVDWLDIAVPKTEWTEEIVSRQAGVNEFSTDEAVEREATNLDRARTAGAQIGQIRLTIEGTLSNYDAEYGEFYVQPFSPGSRLPFRPFARMTRNPFPDGVEIRFRNGSEASVWKVDRSTAERIADQLGYGRYVRLETSLAIAEVNATGRGAAIITDVQRYQVFSRDGERLGAATFAPGAG
jgi:hypothetical protein